jgi:hypothetical protein
MASPLNLEHTFERARRRRPEPLPADFAGSVMQQLAATRDRANRLPGFWPMAAAAVLTAAAIGLLSSPRPDSPQPPKLAVFGGSAAHSPFVNP